MARTDIARVVARAVLEAELDQVDPGMLSEQLEGRSVDLKPVIDALLASAATVRRVNRRNVGEVVELVWVVPPDPTEPEE